MDENEQENVQAEQPTEPVMPVKLPEPAVVTEQKKTDMAPIIAGVILILLIALAGYYLFSNGKTAGTGSATSSVISSVSTTSASSTIPSTTTVAEAEARNSPESVNGFFFTGLSKAYSPNSYGIPANEIYSYMVPFESNQLVLYTKAHGINFSDYVLVPGNMSYLSWDTYLSNESLLELTELTFVSNDAALNSFNMISNFTPGPHNTTGIINKTILSGLPDGMKGVSFLIRNTSNCGTPAPKICPLAFVTIENNSYVAIGTLRIDNGTQVNTNSQQFILMEKILKNLTS